MPEGLEIYSDLLDLEPLAEPPNYYQLLDIANGESDPDKIQQGYDRQEKKLRSKRLGSRRKKVERLSNDLAKAIVVLRDPAQRKVYDRTLKEQVAARATKPLELEPQGLEIYSELLDLDPLEAQATKPVESERTLASSLFPPTNHRFWERAVSPRMVTIVLCGVCVIFSFVLLGGWWAVGVISQLGRKDQISPPEAPSAEPLVVATSPPEAVPVADAPRTADAPPAAVFPFNAVTAKQHQQAWATYLELPVEQELALANDVKLKMLFIPPGEFQMGSPASEQNRDSDEDQVDVTLTQGFYLGETEVTQAQWSAVMGTEPWAGKSYIKEGPTYPATYVTWNDAVAFCAKLTEQEQAAGRLANGSRYDLPTEAQWEYACRAGTTTAYYFGDDPARLGEFSWIRDNTWDIGERYAHEARLKIPNAWNLYDMPGNVREWVRDGYQAELPGGLDPAFKTPGTNGRRVLRGGSFLYLASNVRSATRLYNQPDSRNFYPGFRPARTYNLSPLPPAGGSN